MLTFLNRRMTIARAFTGFGAVVVLSLAIIVGIALYGMKTAGIGGSRYDLVMAGQDLVADILPPPEYVIEAYLEVNLLQNRHGDPAIHKARLARLHKDFDDRRAYWKASALPDDLKRELTEGAGGEADRFWSETETHFLPAIDRDDKAAAAQSFDRLTAHYVKHRAAIDDVVIRANAFSSDVETAAKAETPMLTGIVAVSAALVLAIVVAALILIRLRLTAPIVAVARTLTELARSSLRREWETKAQTGLDANLTALREALYGHGKPRRDGDKLYFGECLVNGDNEIVDAIMARFGGKATVFLGDVRVATNILREDGSRATGTRLAEGAASDAVLGNGRTYRGKTEIFGQPYMTIYEPIMDGPRVIGMLYVGVLEAAADSPLQSLDEAIAGNEVGQMRAAIATLVKANAAKDEADREAMEQRYAAADAYRRVAALNQTVSAEQRVVVDALSTALESLAATDLTHTVDVDFPAEYQKLKTDLGGAVAILRDTMRTIRAQSDAIFGVSGEIARTAEDLARRTEQQAASLEETAAALEEITATVRRTADGATHARDVVATTKADAERSGQVVRQAVAAMQGIQQSSQQIGQIIGVIDEIAFQTNLLALNAGVEAARAGEAGRGFAVVASEVRALAQRSAEAAKEIKTLISTSGQQVDQGARLVGETGAALERILTQVAEINVAVAEIAGSTQQQAASLAEVNTAVNQMDQMTQQNAAMVVQSTAVSQNLAHQTENLTELIGRFQIDGEAISVPSAKTPTHPKPSRSVRTEGSGGQRRRA